MQGQSSSAIVHDQQEELELAQCCVEKQRRRFHFPLKHLNFVVVGPIPSGIALSEHKKEI